MISQQGIPTIQITMATNDPPMEAWGSGEESQRSPRGQDPHKPTFFDVVLQEMKREMVERLKEQDKGEEQEEGEEEKDVKDEQGQGTGPKDGKVEEVKETKVKGEGQDGEKERKGKDGQGQGTGLKDGKVKEIKVKSRGQNGADCEGQGHRHGDVEETRQRGRGEGRRGEGTLHLPELPVFRTPPPAEGYTENTGQLKQTNHRGIQPVKKAQQSSQQTVGITERIEVPPRSASLSPCRSTPSIFTRRRSSASSTTLQSIAPAVEQRLNKDKNVAECTKNVVSGFVLDSSKKSKGSENRRGKEEGKKDGGFGIESNCESTSAEKWKKVREVVSITNTLSIPARRLNQRRASASSIMLDSVSLERSELIQALNVSSDKPADDLDLEFVPKLTPLQRHLQRRRSSQTDLPTQAEVSNLYHIDESHNSRSLSKPATQLLARRRSSVTIMQSDGSEWAQVSNTRAQWEEEVTVPLQLSSNRSNGSSALHRASISPTRSVTTAGNKSGRRRASLSPTMEGGNLSSTANRSYSVSPSRQAVLKNGTSTFRQASLMPSMEGCRLNSSWNSLTPSYGAEAGSNRTRSSSLPANIANANLSPILKEDRAFSEDKKLKPIRGVPSNSEKRAINKSPTERLKKHVELITAQMTTAQRLERASLLGALTGTGHLP